MKIITLRATPYKEKDLIIEAISEESIVVFKAISALAPGSKNAFLNTPLLVGEATLIENKKSKKLQLKEFEITNNLFKTMDNLSYIVSLNALAEITNKLMLESEKHLVFNELLAALEAIKNGKDSKSVIIKYILYICKITGYEFNVNSCNRCGSKKDIVTFSFIEGGFICKNCIVSNDQMSLSIEQMRILHNMYVCANYNFENFAYDKQDLDIVLDKLLYFINDNFSTNIEAISLL